MSIFHHNGNRVETQKETKGMLNAVEDGVADAWAAFAELKKRVDVGEVKSGDAFGSRQRSKEYSVT